MGESVLDVPMIPNADLVQFVNIQCVQPQAVLQVGVHVPTILSALHAEPIQQPVLLSALRAMPAIILSLRDPVHEHVLAELASPVTFVALRPVTLADLGLLVVVVHVEVRELHVQLHAPIQSQSQEIL